MLHYVTETMAIVVYVTSQPESNRNWSFNIFAKTGSGVNFLE